ncbi:MAG: hypothetical protein R2941_03940 [Desulfobacterales bacterium]
MESSVKEEMSAEKHSEYLFNYAITRDDLKQVLANLPKEAEVSPVTMEYEIQLLKILSVGWGISFFMGQHPEKEKTAQMFWNAVHHFCQGISGMTAAHSGKEIDYFSILRQRVDIYVGALNAFSDVQDPALVIGPTFAKLCGSEEDLYAIVSGKKIFNQAIRGVREYLTSVQII